MSNKPRDPLFQNYNPSNEPVFHSFTNNQQQSNNNNQQNNNQQTNNNQQANNNLFGGNQSNFQSFASMSNNQKDPLFQKWLCMINNLVYYYTN
jgi:hypothetical protein